MTTFVRTVLGRVKLEKATTAAMGPRFFLYNKDSQNILLIRQFRLPSYLNDNPTGHLIETCAGLLDEDSPEDCIKKEIQEETGYQIERVQKVFEAYMTPGAVTEKLHFFIAEYNNTMKVGKGGGLEQEQEDIEVLEMPFSKAIELLKNGEIQDAKTMLLLQYAMLHKLLDF